MLRKELRRHERRQSLRRRFLAGSTAVVIALGMSVGGAAPAFSAPPAQDLSDPYAQSEGVTTYEQGGLVCNSSALNFQKPAALDGSNLNSDGLYQAVNPNNWGTLSWNVSEKRVTWSINPGWDVDICVKGGRFLTSIDTSDVPDGVTSYVHTYAGLSHLGFRIVATPAHTPTQEVDCVSVTYSKNAPLVNGEHFNITIDPPGAQINATVDRNVTGGYNGLGLTVRAFTVNQGTIPLTEEQVTTGVIEFRYSDYITTPAWTVSFVQTHDIDTWPNLMCGDTSTTETVVPTARMVDRECDVAGSYTLDNIEGVRWFLGDTEVSHGTYSVTSASTIVVRAEAESAEFELATGAEKEFTFVFTEPVDCALPCLPSSAVSYTYYNLARATVDNPANSGLITVAPRAGHSNELCNDFWVVAASWNYTVSTKIWPQTLRSTDPAGEHPDGYIATVGTYFFHAPVECGQGDIYASFTGKPYIGPELFGPHNPFSERFLHGMGFSGPNPTYLNTAPGCNVANPIAPTATPIAECETLGSIDISDVANPYIGYTVYRGAAAGDGSVSELSAVNVAEATEGLFTVVATAMNGYIFAPGTTAQWEFDLGERYECPVEVDLRLTYMEECAPDPTYTFRVRNLSSISVPYTYVVSGNPALNGSGIAAPGDSFFDLSGERTDPAQSFTVTLSWGDGTTIERGSVPKASGNDRVCSLAVEPIVDIECATVGTYTVPEVTGVVWSINGEVVEPDTYQVENAGTIVLRATATSGYVLYAGGALSSTRDFPLVFTVPAPCPDGPLEVAPVAQQSTCETGGASILMPPVDGVLWFVNGAPAAASLDPMLVLEAGTYVVTAEIDPRAAGGPYAFASGVVTEWPFVFTDSDICDLPEQPITNASIGFIDPTCDYGQRLDPAQLVAANSLARLDSYETFSNATYEVVFVTTDPTARFFDSSTPEPGRVVSNGGTVLTFTGTLLGPDRSAVCVTTIELVDPVSYIDNCVDGGSFTIERVDGIVYTVLYNSETPFDVDWNDGELTRSLPAAQGDYVRVIPSAESDLYTISPDPAPFERTFEVYTDDCLPTLPLTEASVTFTPASCLDATNWVILPDAVGVRWIVDGVPHAAGAWAMSSALDVNVRAVALDGYGFSAETTTEWDHTFAPAEEACELSSLAETGSSNALAGIGFAAVLITLAGLGGVIGRRHQRA